MAVPVPQGLYAVSLALATCSQVSLFGFGDVDACEPHHYYGAVPRNCDPDGEASQNSHVCACHSFDVEHRIYESLEKVGLLKRHS